MMALVAILIAGGVFAVVFRLLLAAHRAISARNRIAAHLVLAIGFLVAYLAYVLGYLPLQRALESRFPTVYEFTTGIDDIAAVVPFGIAIMIAWRQRTRTSVRDDAEALSSEH